MSHAETVPESLIALAREDSSARGQLLEGYRPYLTLLARVQIGRQLRGKADPEDLVQETFLLAHREFAGFRGQTEPELTAWLRRILATNLSMLVRHYLGTKARNPALEQRLADEIDQSSWAIARDLAAPISSPSHQASRREQAVLLANALDKLPADYREAIVLRHLEQLAFPEVAERMGRSLDSVKKLWVRGLAALRKLLEDQA
jgi:RNA polymerase sigma-70 factor (ECF subfamily)